MYVNYNRVTKITLEQISYMLATNDEWLERAIVVLHDRQTELEQMTRTTYNDNERGLQVADAVMFSRFAERIKKAVASGAKVGTILSESEKAFARRPWRRPRTPIATICKYRRQILDIIEAKAKARLLQQAQSA